MPRKQIISDAANACILYMDESMYTSAIDGIMAQGIEHADAVETLTIGMRQANGRSVPPHLLSYEHPPMSLMAAMS